jgi:DNA-binding NtrC family response regulator
MSAGRAKVLVVDDKENMLRLLQRMLGEHHDVTIANDGAVALGLLSAQEFDLVLTDIRMPGADGFEVVKFIKERHPDTEVVMMTAYASVEAAVEAIKRGAYDYLQKPFDPDDVMLVVARALERRSLRAQAAELRTQLTGQAPFHQIVGRSPGMQQVFQALRQAADLDITVLITGDSGTGKELAARAIHAQSGRKSGPFIPVNCGALPAELIESELFGHAKGAFSGATSAKAGLWEEAEGGTLFLDEVGELPPVVQVKLNRALQEKEIRRVGENRPFHVNARLVTATNRDLKADVDTGRFREDLFYRLNVFPVRLPPLRQRVEDIPLLADHFLRKYATLHGRAVDSFDPDALQALVAHPWPGNVRELENVIERAVAVAQHDRVMRQDLPPELRGSSSVADESTLLGMSYRDVVNLAREKISREYLSALMRRFQGNVTQAAARAGLERESLHRLLKQYDVRADSFREGADSGGPRSRSAPGDGKDRQ